MPIFVLSILTGLLLLFFITISLLFIYTDVGDYFMPLQMLLMNNRKFQATQRLLSIAGIPACYMRQIYLLYVGANRRT